MCKIAHINHHYSHSRPIPLLIASLCIIGNTASAMIEESLFESERQTRRPLRVLSIDSGEINTIVPAGILLHLKHKTGKPAYENFDLITGAGIGSVLAAGLSMGIEEEVMVTLFEQHATKLYSGSGQFDSGVRNQFLKDIMQETTISETKTNLLLNFYDIIKNRLITSSTKDVKDYYQPDFKLYDLLSAASATPSNICPHFFEGPKTILERQEKYVGINGSAIVGNPALQSLAYLILRDHSHQDVEIYSLGSVISKEYAPLKQFAKGETRELSRFLMDVLPMKTSFMHTLKENIVLQKRGARIFRLCPTLNVVEKWWKKQDSYTDTSPENISRLHNLAYSQVDTEIFESMVKALTAKKWKKNYPERPS